MEYSRSSPFPVTTPLPRVSMPDFNSIPAEKWTAGDASIRRILNRLRPTSDSEDKRNDVVRYLRQLIENSVPGVEVLWYGSGPLKTYLPEGDIDMTVVDVRHLDRNLPGDVYQVLLSEGQNIENKEFTVRDIVFIAAKVYLVKCVVNDIVVDISFNQMSGLHSLGFLELTDCFFRKDNLFKRSVILIKSWCYYESRILGASTGHFSTYALETLVLFIFCMYNASLASPLMVLYRFLEYFSKFDWHNYGISINGPVSLSSLPHGPRIAGVNPVNDSFNRKIINIIDPLKANNNLGQSVHIGTFYRITLALARGAQNLGKILELPKQNIAEEMRSFFTNTFMMHQSVLTLNPGLRLAELSGKYDDKVRSRLMGYRNHGFPHSAVHKPPPGPLDNRPLPIRLVNQAHGSTYEVGSSSGISAPGLVHTPKRRFEFGSVDPGSLAGFEPEQTDLLSVRSQDGRDLNTTLTQSINVVEFPPSTSMINALAFWFKY